MVSSFLSGAGVSFNRLAIVCYDTWPDLDIPLILSGCTRYYVERPGEYEKLYRFLTKQKLIETPALGNIVSLRPEVPSLSARAYQTFASLCQAIWPLMEENRRIFEDFGPNSGSASGDSDGRVGRWDLRLWKQQRAAIGRNNESIEALLRSSFDLIPEEHAELFRRWLSHMDAFALHLRDDCVDYRGHQFPAEVVEIVRVSL